MTDIQILHGEIPPSCAGMRLDQALAQLFDGYSRSRLSQWLKAGQVRVNGQQLRGRDKVWGGEQVEIHAELEEQTDWQAEAIALEIVYEDEQLIVINKPAGLVVHPATGNPAGTLVNALLHHDASLNTIPRAGVVHRIDKDTSGLLVVARTLTAQKSLVEQLQAHSLLREYQAVVTGRADSGRHGRRPGWPPSGTAQAHGCHSKRQAGGNSLSGGGTLSRPLLDSLPSGDGTNPPDSRAHGAYPSSAGGRSGLRWSLAPAERLH